MNIGILDAMEVQCKFSLSLSPPMPILLLVLIRLRPWLPVIVADVAKDTDLGDGECREHLVR